MNARGLTLLAIVSCCFVTVPVTAAAPDDRIPILAWQSPPPELARYREMADAGFTHCYAGASSVADAVKLLDLAQQAGVKLFVSCPELTSDPPATARRLASHPALGGYFLRDEPGAADFPALAKWTQQIQSADREHPCLINLFPNYADAPQLGTPTYAQHLAKFVAEVPVPFISFDHYPVIADKAGHVKLRPNWYENLEQVSEAAAGAGKPFWAFALSVAHGSYPVATVPDLRLQAFSDLAYGAQGIEYFTYWTPVSSTWDFHEAPITADGKRTPVYDRVKQVNAEIQALRRVFRGTKVLSVGHAGDALPAGTRRYEPAAPVSAVRTEGAGAVVSTLAGDGGRRYLVVVNRDVNQAMSLAVEFDGPAKVESIDKQGSAHALSGAFRTQVEPGDVAVLSWTADAR